MNNNRQSKQDAMNNPNRVYFGNLSFEKSNEDVNEIFKDCGEIVDIHIIRDKFTQRSQGYGFITFAEESGRTNALSKNGQEFFGRNLKVNFEAKSKNPGDRMKTRQRLFIKNIPVDKTEDEVKGAFQQFGSVTNFFFIKDHDTGASRGFGFMDFSNAEETQAALSMNGSTEWGQSLIVKIAEEKEEGGRGRGRGRGGFGRGGFGRGRGRGRGGYGQSFAPYGGGYGGGWGNQGGGNQGGGRGGGWGNQSGGYGGGWGGNQGGGYGGGNQGGGYGGGNQGGGYGGGNQGGGWGNQGGGYGGGNQQGGGYGAQSGGGYGQQGGGYGQQGGAYPQ